MLLATILSGLALTLADDPNPNGAKTQFDVRRHGFNFTNYFEGDVLIDVPLIGQVDVGDTAYGLCGGMTYGAADTFAAGGSTPDFVIPPDGNGPAEIQPGTKLRTWIYERQLDTMRADNAFLVRRIIAWTWRPIDDVPLTDEDFPIFGEVDLVTGLYSLSDKEFKKNVAPKIDRGVPVPLLIINADFDDYLPSSEAITPEGFTKNHQVLAIGYRLLPERGGLGKHWAIDIYDPNYPDEVHTLHYDQKGRRQTRRVNPDGTLVASPDDPSRNEVGSFRGFFVTPYDAKVPYWVKSLPDNLGRLSTLLPTSVFEAADEPRDGTVSKWRARERRLANAGRGEPTGSSGTSDATTGGSRPPKKTGSGGLGDLKPPDVTAKEGDTALAIRGKPGVYDVVESEEPRVRLGRLIVEFPSLDPPDEEAESEATGTKKSDPKKGLATKGTAKAGKEGTAKADTAGRDGGAKKKKKNEKKGEKQINAKVELLDPESGKSLTWDNGDFSPDLFPGTYDVVVGNKKIAEVPIFARHDTVVLVGALRVEAGESTKIEILDEDEETVITWNYGSLVAGLPPGKYFVRMASQTMSIDVPAGVVTEF